MSYTANGINFHIY